MATIKIYGVPPSTFTRAVRMGCHEKGIDYELVPTRPGEVRALNPFGKIPAITHGDTVLYESAAILRYLDRTFPGPKLWPLDNDRAALVDQWVAATSDSVQNSAQLFFLMRLNIVPLAEPVAQQCLARAREIIPAFDRQLAQNRFLAGNELTAADLLFAPIFAYFPMVPELKELADSLPNCRRWMEEIASRPSFAATDPALRPQKAA